MIRPASLACLAACLVLGGCHQDNPSTGNDTEASLDPPKSAAPHRSAAEALAGVSMDDVQPETMSKADLDSLGGARDRCLFRLTAVGWPSFVYGGGQPTGILKLNETLITLPRTHPGAFADSGLEVTLRPLDDGGANGARHEADLIIRLPHTPQELGFKGYSECRGKSARTSATTS
jgi:hypothetical protein